MAAQHRVSDFMCERWPILPELREDGSKSVSIAYGDRTFTKLQERLQSGDLTDVQISQCYQMFIAECSNPHACVEAVEVGVLRGCMMSLASPNAGIRLVALRLLTQLLGAEVGRRCLQSESSWLEALGNMCEHDEGGAVRTAAAEALHAFVLHGDGRSWLLTMAPTVIGTMVRSLPATPSSIHALSTLASEEPRSVPALLSADAIKCVSSLLLKAVDPVVVASAVTLLKNILHDDQGKLDALKHQVLRSLEPFLHTADQNQLLRIFETMMLLSVPPEGKAAIMDDANANIVDCCVASLRSADSRIAFVASNLIRSLCKSDPARSIIVPRVVVHSEVFIRVFRESMCESLVNLLECGDAVLVSHVLMTIDALLAASVHPTELALTMASMLHCRESLECLVTGYLPLARRDVTTLPVNVQVDDVKLAASVLHKISILP